MEFFLIATDLDINADGFSWDEVTRRGSRGLVIWKSTDLVSWGEPWLAECVHTSSFHTKLEIEGRR